MSLVNSPKVEYSADGKPPDRKNWRRILIRGGLFALLIFGLGLNLYAIIAGNAINRIVGTDGRIQGVVLDEEGQPLAGAEITLASYPAAVAQTDANGRFDLSDIPSGVQYLIVVYDDIGQGFVVEVNEGGAALPDPLVYDAKPAVWE
ncbi:MAG: carboxypeptidase regulatory-like domain-containing protein [Chloroflexi bacterium]|nr:carboxypeptidase regulatory-like domain-containing protein [Chloroflexota bacterium]